METNLLESKLDGVKPLASSGTYDAKPNYAGLKLVQEKPYFGGTSIRYWM
jgi:hypothetical protein